MQRLPPRHFPDPVHPRRLARLPQVREQERSVTDTNGRPSLHANRRRLLHLLSHTPPPSPSLYDGIPLVLGVRVTVTTPGTFTAVRFFKVRGAHRGCMHHPPYHLVLA